MDTTEQKGLTRELFSDILPKLSIAAKAFVFALDKCRNTLSELERIEKEAGSTRPIAAVRASFLGSFPDLKGVRDSAHHEEQRAQQKRDHGKPITAQPVNKLGISCDATSTVFAVGLISGSKYCATMANGHLGEVDVSFKSLEILRDAIQSALDAYKWRGPRSIYPNY